jgi:hypothetical protein
LLSEEARQCADGDRNPVRVENRLAVRVTQQSLMQHLDRCEPLVALDGVADRGPCALVITDDVGRYRAEGGPALPGIYLIVRVLY